PSLSAVNAAIKQIADILHPRRDTGNGYKHAKLDPVLQARLELMSSLLRLYSSNQYTDWAYCSDLIAVSAGKGSWLSRRLRVWCIEFICHPGKLPKADYGKGNSSVLEHEDHAQELHLHLQGAGKFVAAQDVVDYINSPEVLARWRMKKPISLRTAQRWMNHMSYRWKKAPRGMYADGHEREDVVDYRQNVFVPRWEQLNLHTRKWTRDGAEDHQAFVKGLNSKPTAIWRHDESTYYANDRRTLRWVHSSEKAKPYAKGEGASMMVADFVSPDYGWLR
ncbi:hypothetical protein F5050DRAFT_1555801, partial [Lentinula boryana]